MSRDLPPGRRQWVRSMLFVPGNRRDWIVRASERFGPDAVLVDWEDAVPLSEKATARRLLTDVIDQLKDQPAEVYVRVNGWGTGELLADLDAAVIAGVVGLALPKFLDPNEISALDLAIMELELVRGLEPGGIDIFPFFETAPAILQRAECLATSERIRRTSGISGSAPGGDYYRATGFEWRSDGAEVAVTSALASVAARAVGISNILCGPVSKLDDLDFVRRVFARARGQGANGAVVIHPSHVSIAHEIFSPTETQVAEAVGVLRAMAVALEEGKAAARHQGKMIDYADVRSSLDVIELAVAVGVSVPEDLPHIDLHWAPGVPGGTSSHSDKG
jgi:citrate lyase subunit beta / citryl-CoA lyase